MKKKIIKAPSLSLSAKVSQFAEFLRTKAKEPVKKKARTYTKGAPDVSSSNVIQQIAKKIRKEINDVKDKRDAA